MKQKIMLIMMGLLSIMLVANVLATGFSPTSLTFNLNPDDEECQTITVTSDSETVAVSDKWAENKDIEWKVSLFDKQADYHSISIIYPDEIVLPDNEVEVCLSGSEIGEYHGVLLLREEQEGNSVVQMGVWLKVVIEEEQEEVVESNTHNDGSSGGSGGGAAVTPAVTVNTTSNNQLMEENDAEININNNENEAGGKAGITGNVIGNETSKENMKIIWIIVAVMAIGALVIGYKQWRKRRLQNLGY